MRKHHINFRTLLAVLLIIIGVLFAFLGMFLIREQTHMNELNMLRTDIQSRGQVLSDKMSRQMYITDNKDDALINSEIDLIAEIYNGRVVVVNSSFKVVRDTFAIANGKYVIAPEVIGCFNGTNSNRLNEENNYVVQTFPITDITDGKTVIGALLITASTETVAANEDKLKSSANFILVLVLLLLIPVAAGLSILLTKPFYKLKDSLKKIANGNLNDTINQPEYKLTNELASAINGTINRLKTVDASRDEFVANVSHELKTPITSIRVLADSLMSMEDVPNELYKEFMEDISNEIDREASIIDDLLELVKMDESEAALNVAPVDMDNMLKNILKRVRPLADKREIELIFETVRDVVIDGDETKLSLAFMNIIENGIKYNEQGGKLTVTLDADHQFCFVKIEDTGIGIPEEFKDLIFERFYRVDKARSRQSGGTGLGLAITRKIVLLHNGVIKVKSEEGEGTTFTVRIPLKYMEQSK